jgi:hypothetical protein
MNEDDELRRISLPKSDYTLQCIQDPPLKIEAPKDRLTFVPVHLRVKLYSHLDLSQLQKPVPASSQTSGKPQPEREPERLFTTEPGRGILKSGLDMIQQLPDDDDDE